MICFSRRSTLARENRLAQVDEIHKIPETPSLGVDYVPEEYVSNENRMPYIFDKIIESSQYFYSHSTPTEFCSNGNLLIFESNLSTQIPENNTVYCKLYPSSDRQRVAVILPYWNADGESFNRIASLLAFFGVSALRMSLPYHDQRRPSTWPIAKHMVSPNIGRTIQAIRQAVLDVRCGIDWLISQGFSKIALIGFSIGSCIATIAAAHDPRVRTIAQILMASNFAEVVWTGMSTRHIRKSLETCMDLGTLKSVWAGISPDTYVRPLSENSTKVLMVTGRYDPVFLPRLAAEIEQKYLEYSIDYQWRVLRCGHYTLGDFPHNAMALGSVIRWLRRSLQ